MAIKPKTISKIADTVKVADLIPPFRVGDWVTAVTSDSLQFLPKDENDLLERHVIQLRENAVYVGSKSDSGWLLFNADTSHFRLASYGDIQKEMLRISSSAELLKETYEHLQAVAKNWRTRGVT